MLIVGEALAQAGAAAPDPGPMGRMIAQAVYILPLIVIFYFLLIRPQQQQAKKQKQMLVALKKGDRVLTTGGLFGTVVGIDDHKVVLRIADEVKAEFAKSAVTQVLAPETK